MCSTTVYEDVSFKTGLIQNIIAYYHINIYKIFSLSVDSIGKPAITTINLKTQTQLMQQTCKILQL